MTTLDTIVNRQQQQVVALALNSKERNELYRLRTEISELRSTVAGLRAAEQSHAAVSAMPSMGVPMGAIAEAMAASCMPTEAGAKTIGFKMPEELRLQLIELVDAYKAKSYKHVVLACIRLGITQLKGGIAEVVM